MRFWIKGPPAVMPPPVVLRADLPPAATVVLSAAEVEKLLPALWELFHGQLSNQALAQMYDTLLNSAVTPPPPWPQKLYRFSHMIQLASTKGHALFLVFYPI